MNNDFLCNKYHFMNSLSVFFLKACRKIYGKLFGAYQPPRLPRIEDPDQASDLIYHLLSREEPCMIARFGATELSCIVNYLNIQRGDHHFCKYIKGETGDWWWNHNIMTQMEHWSGFFPPTPEKLTAFCELMLKDSSKVDLLASWLKNEYYLKDKLQNIPRISLLSLEPYWSKHPWSRILSGKKVLVIHPFAELIKKQYQRRQFLFKNPEVLPEFELHTIKAVQSLGGASNGFKDWFEALHWMEKEMDKVNYDICLIGCGAYGFPLAAHAKETGHQAIHLGGALQLLFGIKGKRWENPEYGLEYFKERGIYLKLFNEYWVRPANKLKPLKADSVEGACYW